MKHLFAVYGNPVTHSKSPLIHNYAIKELNLDADYIKIEAEDKEFLIKSFYDNKLTGANITVPFKEDAYHLCDEVIGVANEIKAVNTIIKKDNKLVGYNTDGDGFLTAIDEFKDINSALILGAGGTAKAVAIALKNSGVFVTVLNRSQQRLEFFKDNQIESFVWDEFLNNSLDINRSFDLVINTTSAGLNDEELPLDKELLENIFKRTKYAFEVIYNKETPFLSLAKSNLLEYKDGEEMLVNQAVYAFLKFHNMNDFYKIQTLMNKAINS